MERRRSERKKANFKAVVISGEATYHGTIENLSQHGLYLETDTTEILKDADYFAPGIDCEVKFSDPSGEEISLNCKIAWSYRIAPEGIKAKVGLEILFPPPVFLELYRSI